MIPTFFGGEGYERTARLCCTKAMPDPICVICSRPIRPTQSIVKSDGGLVHVDCFLDHPSVADAA
jgi:hypothetical protein